MICRIARLWHELTTLRPKEKNVSYCESHDQALVGDKTLIFRMADSEMYQGMDKSYHSFAIDCVVALHTMIRSITLTLDFPRDGNGWSFKYVRRQWSLAKNGYLKYQWLEDFDKAMLKFARKYRVLSKTDVQNLLLDNENKIISLSKGDLFSTDNMDFGGQDRVSERYVYYAKDHHGKGFGFEAYVPNRTSIVFKKTSRLTKKRPSIAGRFLSSRMIRWPWHWPGGIPRLRRTRDCCWLRRSRPAS